MLKPTDIKLELAQKWINHLIELKYDGTRGLYLKGDLFTERKIIRNDRFPQIIKALKGIDCILDGEIALSETSNVFDVSRKVNWYKAKYFVFDILELNGEDLRGLSLLKRRFILISELGKLKSKYLNLPRTFKTLKEGWDYVKKNNREGLIIKDLTSTYPKGDIFKGIRSKNWFKLKNWKETELEVIGHEKGSDKGTFILKDNIRISALSPKMVIEWKDLRQKGTVFAEVSYLKKTDSGKLFQPILKRLVVIK